MNKAVDNGSTYSHFDSEKPFNMDFLTIKGFWDKFCCSNL